MIFGLQVEYSCPGACMSRIKYKPLKYSTVQWPESDQVKYHTQ